MPAADGKPIMSQEASSETPYDRLDPDTLIRAVESTGLLCDGRLLALNSYENRVYQVGLEQAEPVIAKFYRPGRWSDAQDRKSTRLNSSHSQQSRMPSSA